MRFWVSSTLPRILVSASMRQELRDTDPAPGLAPRRASDLPEERNAPGITTAPPHRSRQPSGREARPRPRAPRVIPRDRLDFFRAQPPSA